MLPPRWRFAPVVEGPHGLEFSVAGPDGQRARTVSQLTPLSIAATAMSLALDAWITHQNLEGVRLAAGEFTQELGCRASAGVRNPEAFERMKELADAGVPHRVFVGLCATLLVPIEAGALIAYNDNGQK